MKVIALEGIDGCGKTTLVPMVARWLEDLGYSVKTVVEPQDELIRKLLRKVGDNGWISTLLFAADRMMTYENIEEVDFVVMDRSVLTSIVYQKAQNVDTDYILEVNDYEKILVPDLFIYIFKPVFDEEPDYASSEIIDDVLYNYNKMAKNIDRVKTVVFHYGQPFKTLDEIKEVIKSEFDI